jgi:radical SAM protein with 4Fe4S-binding SPASM domain
VTALLARRHELGRKYPRVHISFTVSKYNVWEMTKIVRLVQRMGADQLAFSNLVLDHPEHAHVSAVGSKVFDFNLKRALRLAEQLGVKASYFPQIPFPFLEQPQPAIEATQRWGCPEAWRALIVEKDGTLKPCCYLKNTFGNVRDGELPELLNAPKAVNFRKLFTERRYLNTCRGCGQFYRISDEETRGILDTVQQRIEAGNFSDAGRILLEEKLAYFRALFEQSKAERNIRKEKET